MRTLALATTALATTMLFAAVGLCGGAAADPVRVAQAGPAEQPGHASPAPNTANDTLSTVKDAAGTALGTASAEMTFTSQGFVTAAALDDMYEVAAGRIAESRTHNSKIAELAHEMVAAHTQSSDKLKSILPGSGTEVTLPDHLDMRRQAMLDELHGAKAADFDSRYLSQQVDIHREALILMQGYQKNGDVTALKHFAADATPVVQHHLDMAQHLYDGARTN